MHPVNVKRVVGTSRVVIEVIQQRVGVSETAFKGLAGVQAVAILGLMVAGRRHGNGTRQ